MLHDADRIAERVKQARAKILLTMHNDPVPSKRLAEAASILGQILIELEDSNQEAK